jgi:hypothetical protein
MFRPISGHPQVHNWSLKHIEEEIYISSSMPIPVAARSKVWVYGRSIAGIVGSNPAGGWMSVSCECYARGT